MDLETSECLWLWGIVVEVWRWCGWKESLPLKQQLVYSCREIIMCSVML